jgi:hypothetical protein
MHIKCIYGVYWIIYIYIFDSLLRIWICFFTESQDFLNNSLYFGFNYVVQKTLILRVFFSFKDLSDVKRTQSFFHVSFLRNQRSWEEDIVKHHEVEKRVHHMVPLASHMVGPNFHPVGPFSSFLASTESWNNYIYDSPGYFSTGRQQRIHNIDSKTAMIRGEPLPEPLPVAPSSSSISPPSSPW